MSFTEALPPRAKELATGISFAIRRSRGCVEPRFTFTEAVQKQYFGGAVVGKKAKVLIGTGDDAGTIKITVAPDGTIPFKPSVRGSVALAVRAWEGLPTTPRNAKRALGVRSDKAGEVVFRVPDMHSAPEAKQWGGARPNKVTTPAPEKKAEPYIVKKTPMSRDESAAALERAVRGSK